MIIKNKSISNADFFNTENPFPLELAYHVEKKPRYYQTNGIYQLNEHLKNNFKRILFISPTGTGKTLISKLVVLSKEVRKTLGWEEKKKIRVLFIVHKHRLLRQAAMEFADCHDIELITQSAFSNVPKHVIEEGWDITFIDEAHHEAMMSIQNLLDQLGNIPIIGFTANANRGDSLLVKFEKFIYPITKLAAIKKGFISEPGINTIVDTGSRDKSDITIQIVNKYHKSMGNTIVFFKTNKECEKFDNYCSENGLMSKWLDLNSTEKDLDDALDALSEGRIQFLINCKKVDEGIDILNCTDVILARNFGTESEKEQLAGRGIRPDTPCTLWELTNPYIENVEASDVIGSYRFQRLIYNEDGVWNDDIISGVDETWGLGSELRFEYIKENLGFDPRIETYEDVIEDKKHKETTVDIPKINFIEYLKSKKISKKDVLNALDNYQREIVDKMEPTEIKKIAISLVKSGRI